MKTFDDRIKTTCWFYLWDSFSDREMGVVDQHILQPYPEKRKLEILEGVITGFFLNVFDDSDEND